MKKKIKNENEDEIFDLYIDTNKIPPLIDLIGFRRYNLVEHVNSGEMIEQLVGEYLEELVDVKKTFNEIDKAFKVIR